MIDGAGIVNFNNLGHSLPRDRVEYGTGWTSGRHTVNVLGRYVSSDTNDRSGITETHIKSCNTFDLQYMLSLDDLIGQNCSVTIGAVIVADRDPSAAQLNLGYDPIVYDPRGRELYVAVTQNY